MPPLRRPQFDPSSGLSARAGVGRRGQFSPPPPIAAAKAPVGKALYVSVTAGLPAADPTAPLLRYRMKQNWTLGNATGDAGVAATSPASFIVKRDGVANGFIKFTGTAITDLITERQYPSGSLFELYPPATADTTLDNVSITIPLTVA